VSGSSESPDLLAQARSELLAGFPAAALQTLLRVDDSQATGACLNIKGVAHHQLGDLPRAVSLLTRATELNACAQHHNNLANALRDAGALEAAVAHYRSALNQNRESPEIWCNLGTTLAELGDVSAAIESFEAALRHGPELADAYGALGVLRSHQGQQEAAIKYLRHALRLAPERAAFHDALGLALQRNDDLTAAVSAYRSALQLAPSSAETWNNLGHTLRLLGHSRDAVNCFEQATQLAPQFVEAHNNLGIAHQECGDLAAAEHSFRRAIELRPHYAMAHFNRAELRRFDRDDPRLKELQCLIETRALPDDEDQALLHFALGKAWDDLQSPSQAFEHWQQANRIVRSRLQYDEAASLEVLARIGKNAVPLPHLDDPDADDQLHGSGCIFIIGLPRSGSTLVEQIIAAHPDAGTRGESPLMERLLREVGSDRPTALANDSLQLSPERISTIRKLYLEAAPSKAFTIDKFLGNALHVGSILRIFPRARLIYLARDPMDVALSCYSKRFSSGHAYSYELEELARYIVAFEELMRCWCKWVPAQNMLTVTYEKLVEDFVPQVERLCGFLGLPMHERCLEFHKHVGVVATASAAQVRQPLNRRSLQRWRAYQQQLEPIARIFSAARIDG
jgi:tetratricopeptide (TPR) repeat protein